MSIASFFLVTFENEREEVRRAGMTYLVASQLGVVFLFVLFAILAPRRLQRSTSTPLPARRRPRPDSRRPASCSPSSGFGTKAGFWPVHIWLPDAHPAAPSHVSALMSGVMIKMGIYGLLRTLTFLGPPPAWWGGVLIAIGVVSGLAGVLHALAQHDLKRLLAYHSVENIGIIALGIGVGAPRAEPRATLRSPFSATPARCCTSLNHGLFKGLLFQGAGSVLHATGNAGHRLARRPLAAACRRPPLRSSSARSPSAACRRSNGFVSEWLDLRRRLPGGAGRWPHGSAVPVFARSLRLSSSRRSRSSAVSRPPAS